MSDWVYGIQSGLFIKIGVARNIPARVRQMQLCNPHPIKVVMRRWCEHAYWVEGRMHELLKPHAIGREWFAISAQQAREAFRQAAKDNVARQIKQRQWEIDSSARAAQREADKKAKATRGTDVESGSTVPQPIEIS